MSEEKISLPERVTGYCACLSLTKIVLLGLLLAAVFEIITVCMRFGLEMESTRDTRFLASITLGIRIHHGYLGVLLALVACWIFRNRKGLRNMAWIVAVGLIASDLVHHFLVLWPVTGSPEFHLVYPP